MADAKDAVVPNGAAPPTNEPTKTKGMPNKMSLTLSHLPSKKDIKLVYPRTPSSVSIQLVFIPCSRSTKCIYALSNCSLALFRLLTLTSHPD